MALKPCRECGQDVSTQAEKCPHCGVRNPAGKLIDTSLGGNCSSCIGCLFAVVIGFLGLVAIGFCAPG